MWRSAFFNGKWPLWVFLDATSPCRRDSSGLHECEYSSFACALASRRQSDQLSSRSGDTSSEHIESQIHCRLCTGLRAGEDGGRGRV